MQIPERFKHIIENIKTLANEINIPVYIVGGFTRDIIMGRDPKDLDIMADYPDGGIWFSKQLSQKFGYSDPVVFPRFGTAQLTTGNNTIEFVMPRSEYYYEDSRKPDTEYTSIQADALRRDFSINAFFYRINDDTLLDLTGHGLSDIDNKVINVTDRGNEDIIFTQDPLRLLRAVRFACQLDFEISAETWLGILRNVEKIKTISTERINEELNKILVSKHILMGIEMLRVSRLIDYIIPEVNTMYDMKQPDEFHHKDVYQHTLLVLDNIKNTLELRLTALLHDVGKPIKRTILEDKIHFYEHEQASGDIAKDVLTRLKYSNDIINKVEFLIRNHMRPHSFSNHWSDSAVRRFVRDMGDNLEDIFEIVRADVTSSKPDKVQMHLDNLDKFKERIRQLEEIAKSASIKPLLNGNELMSIFVKGPGKWIKEVHEKLIERQLENPNLSREEAITIAKGVLEEGMDSEEAWPDNPGVNPMGNSII